MHRRKNECCVCMEETNTITECGHHLCVKCLGNMYKHDKDRGTFIMPLLSSKRYRGT